MTRLGLELFLARFPESETKKPGWKLPKVNSGSNKVPLESLKDIARDEEAGFTRVWNSLTDSQQLC